MIDRTRAPKPQGYCTLHEAAQMLAMEAIRAEGDKADQFRDAARMCLEAAASILRQHG